MHMGASDVDIKENFSMREPYSVRVEPGEKICGMWGHCGHVLEGGGKLWSIAPSEGIPRLFGGGRGLVGWMVEVWTISIFGSRVFCVR